MTIDGRGNILSTDIGKALDRYMELIENEISKEQDKVPSEKVMKAIKEESYRYTTDKLYKELKKKR
ncbi:MAG: hypothetical protein Q4F21_10360 [Lachnospiraceae bacterium]|nr:hypothetical protein [Lachnospiraceae bacterium]